MKNKNRDASYHRPNSHTDSLALRPFFIALLWLPYLIVCPSGLPSRLTLSIPFPSSLIFLLSHGQSAWLYPSSRFCLLGPLLSHSLRSFPRSIALPVSVYSSRRYLNQCSTLSSPFPSLHPFLPLIIIPIVITVFYFPFLFLFSFFLFFSLFSLSSSLFPFLLPLFPFVYFFSFFPRPDFTSIFRPRGQSAPPLASLLSIILIGRVSSNPLPHTIQ